MGADVIVSVPARPDFVHVLRSTVSSVGASLELTYDGIDDLRIAVAEACARLLAIPSPATVIELRIRLYGDRIEVVAATDADGVEWPPSEGEEGLTWQILTALSDEVRFERSELGPALRIVKRAAPGRGGS